ncbi:MAG: hypothetical protein AAGU17_09215 [Anaerolineaceae bacterium]|jgi:hypothetical protein
MTYKGMEEDRKYLTRSIEELAQYLSSDVLLWRMTGIQNALCPGNVLLALHRLSIERTNDIFVSTSSIKGLIEKRQSAWDKKVKRELPMRVNQWHELVEDFFRNKLIDGSYSYNIRSRVILNLLMRESRFLDQELQSKIEHSDEILIKLARPGDFVWDRELLTVFPQAEYPYLYYEQAERL